jgi:glycosyltransferase involved in cell wall biosynthesis
MSSSIPEIGEDLVYYFDPYSLKSFADAFDALEHLLSKENDQIREKCRQRASQFTWSRFAEKIIERVNTDVRKGINGGI